MDYSSEINKPFLASEQKKLIDDEKQENIKDVVPSKREDALFKAVRFSLRRTKSESSLSQDSSDNSIISQSLKNKLSRQKSTWELSVLQLAKSSSPKAIILTRSISGIISPVIKKYNKAQIENLTYLSSIFDEYFLNEISRTSISDQRIESLLQNPDDANLSDLIQFIKRFGSWKAIKDFLVFCIDINSRIEPNWKERLKTEKIRFRNADDQEKAKMLLSSRLDLTKIKFPKYLGDDMVEAPHNLSWNKRHKLMEAFIKIRKDIVRRSLFQAIAEVAKENGNLGLKIERLLSSIEDEEINAQELIAMEKISIPIRFSLNKFVENGDEEYSSSEDSGEVAGSDQDEQESKLVDLVLTFSGSQRITSDLDLSCGSCDLEFLVDVLKRQLILWNKIIPKNLFEAVDSNLYDLEEDFVEEYKEKISADGYKELNLMEVAGSIVGAVRVLIEKQGLSIDVEGVKNVLTNNFLVKQGLDLDLLTDQVVKFLTSFNHLLTLKDDSLEQNRVNARFGVISLMQKAIEDVEEKADSGSEDDLLIALKNFKFWDIVKNMLAFEASVGKDEFNHTVIQMQDGIRDFEFPAYKLANAILGNLSHIIEHTYEGLDEGRLIMTFTDTSKHWERVSDALFGESTKADTFEKKDKISCLAKKQVEISEDIKKFLSLVVDFRRIIKENNDNPQLWREFTRKSLVEQYRLLIDKNFSADGYLTGEQLRSLYTLHLKYADYIAKDMLELAMNIQK